MSKQRTAVTGEPSSPSEDSLAFRDAVRDVKPLEAMPPPAGLAAPRPRKRRRVAVAAGLEADLPLIATPDAAGGEAAVGSIGGGDALRFQRPGVRLQEMKRLRRGLIPIDGELDLHGLAQTAARDRLVDFLRAGRAGGWRCVRVIHGKGYRSGTRGPILKIAVDAWLRRHPDVLAFTSARPIDGGTGAVYVLLRA